MLRLSLYIYGNVYFFFHFSTLRTNRIVVLWWRNKVTNKFFTTSYIQHFDTPFLALFSFPSYTLAVPRVPRATGVKLYTTTATVWLLFSPLHNDGWNVPVAWEVSTTNELSTAYVELFMMTALSWLTHCSDDRFYITSGRTRWMLS
jgi:hypothetical protein